MCDCDVCTDGIVGRYESEPIYCTYCAQGIGKHLNALDERLGFYAERLARLDALHTLGRLDKVEQAARNAIAVEFERLKDEYDALERQFHKLANPVLAKVAAA